MVWSESVESSRVSGAVKRMAKEVKYGRGSQRAHIKLERYHFLQYCMAVGYVHYSAITYLESKMRQNVGKINGGVELWNAANGTEIRR